jgi:multiple sugar transport system substrate-binding protein
MHGERQATRRTLLLGAAGALGGAALAACAGAPAATSGTTKRAAGGTATFMASGDAERFQIRDNLMPLLLETTGVKGEWIHFTGAGYYDKLFAMLASDTAPDLIYYTPAYFIEFVVNNWLRNLTPLIKRDKYDLSDFPERAIAQYTYQGNQHGFPQDFPTRALFYNPELFKRAGLALPPGNYGFNPSTWNWQVFLEAARRLTSPDAQSGTGAYGWNTQFGWRPYSVWIFANGGEAFNKDLSECTITEAKSVEALQLLSDLTNRHKVAPTRQVTSAEGYEPMFIAGRVAMNESLPGAINRYRATQGFAFDVAPIPVGSNGAKVCTGGGSGYGMFAGTKNLDAAWEFFKFIEGPEAQLAHARGGATYPSRLSIQVHPEVYDPNRWPKNFKLFVEGQKYVRLDPQVTTWREIEPVVARELTPLWDGQRSARDAAEAVKRAVDPLLKQATTRKMRDE